MLSNIADMFNIVIFCRGGLLFQAAVTPYVSELILSLNGRIDSSLTDVNHAMVHMLFMLLRLHIRSVSIEWTCQFSLTVKY